ncbi:MAG TPA: hypothetical protein VGD31_04165, partial [Sphingobacteriaceae bacterium]
VFSDLRHDARVNRQINWLRIKYQVTAVCFESDPIAGVEIIKIRQAKLTAPRKALLAAALTVRAFNIAFKLLHPYHDTLSELKQRSFDFIFANDIDTLPLAFAMKNNAKVVFDAHEYAPRHFENNKIWKTFFQPFYIHLCKKFISKTDLMLTVGKGLAREYEVNFGVKPIIITNATRFVDIAPSPVVANKIRLVHHGIANPSRRLELMVEMMKRLNDRFTLDLMLMTSDFASGKTRSYIEEFKQRAASDPRIKILPPVKSHDVVETINRYDIGVFLLPPVNFNYANALPNKLFDYIQARLGIAIGPSFEMAEIVREYQNGVVAKDFTAESLADALRNLTSEDVVGFKERSEEAAKQVNADQNEKLLMERLAVL